LTINRLRRAEPTSTCGGGANDKSAKFHKTGADGRLGREGDYLGSMQLLGSEIKPFKSHFYDRRKTKAVAQANEPRH